MRLRPRVVDIVLAGVCAALTVGALFWGLGQDSTQAVAGSRAWVLPLFLLPSAALLVRRTLPVVSVAGVWVPYALHAAVTRLGAEGLFLVVSGWASLYALTAYGRRRQVYAGLAVAVGSLVVHDVNDPLAWGAGGEAAWAAAFWDLILFVPALAGGVVAGLRQARRLAAEKDALDRRRRDEAQQAVADERARIARELHDVVTHNVNVVVLQAMAASGVLDSDPGRVREPLAVIERSAREALEEMRRLLGVLREVDGAPARSAPQPGVEDLGDLLDGGRHSGLTVEIAVEGPRRRLPGAVGLTVYRIVQESLTNSAKHAADARVAVRLRYEPDAIDVCVVDDGPRRAGRAEGAAGHGLLGMRERVDLFGGTLQAGPRTEGGFAVRARLPLEREPA